MLRRLLFWYRQRERRVRKERLSEGHFLLLARETDGTYTLSGYHPTQGGWVYAGLSRADARRYRQWTRNMDARGVLAHWWREL